MFNMKWRLVVARTLVVVLAGNPVLMAAHGIERSHRPEAGFDLTERREQLRLQTQAAAAARAAAQTVNKTAQLAAGQQAAQKHSANGTEVIDIAAPGQSGVSHNQFMQFNVSADGLILNNSQGPALSALGGWTDGNRRLAGGTARLILAEVTGTGRSSLLGYTEVLGDAAEFVLANPNGISCNGCGFINTPRVVLATGIPDLINGNLAGINISGGDVVIDGAGLNASNVNKFDILTRAMTLNAALYANELNIRTGSNYYDFNSLQAQANANQPDSSPAYQFALDASALGAMYANSISLIGTEAGLGVRSQGLISSVDSLQLTADGRLELKDTLAGGDLALRSQRSDIITNGSTYGQTVNVAAAGTLDNSGIIAAAQNMQLSAAALQQSGDVIAGINQLGEWQQGAEQQLSISGTAVNQGRIISSGAQQLTATEWQNRAAALLQGDVTTLSSTVLNNNGTLNSNALTLDSETANNAGHIQAQQLSINAEQFNQTAGALYQTGADGQLSLTGRELQLDGGVLVAEGTAEVKAIGQLRNNAAWLMAGDSAISAAELINSGTVQLQGAADLTADSLNNSGNMLFAAEQATALSIKNTLDNQGGLLQFGTAAEVSAAEINNDSGQISHTGNGTMSLHAAQQLNNTAGQILSNGNMQISAADLNNQQGTLSAEQLTLTVGGNINNQAGTIQGTALELNAQQLTNTDGVIHAAAGLNVHSDAVKNQGGVISADSLTLGTDVLDNSAGQLLAAAELDINSAQLNNTAGVIHSQQHVQISAGGLNNHAGVIQGVTSFTAQVQHSIDNQAGQLLSDNRLQLHTGLLNNAGGVVAAAEQSDIHVTELQNTADAVVSAGRLNITADTVTNDTAATIEAQQLTLSAQTLDNAGIVLASGRQGESLQLLTKVLSNQGRIESHGENFTLGNVQLDNRHGQIYHQGTGVLQLDYLAELRNNEGEIYSAGQLNIAGAAIDNTNGTLIAQQSLQLTASALNNSTGSIQTAGDLKIGTAAFNNRAGVAAAGADLQLSATDISNQAGVLRSAAQLDISAGSLDNEGGEISAVAAADIRAVQLSNDNGNLVAGDLSLQLSGALSNQQGTVFATDTLSVAATDIDNTLGTVAANGDIQLDVTTQLNNSGGLVQAAGSLIANAKQMNNSDGTIQATTAQLNSQQSLNNSNGTVNAQTLALSAAILDNSYGVILATDSSDNALQLTGISQLTNDNGTIASHGNNWQLALDNLSNDNGKLLHLGSGTFTLSQAGTLNNSGTIASNANLVLNATDVANSGTLQAQQQLQLNAGLDNQAGAVLVANDISVNAPGRDISNAGSVSANNSLQLSGASLNNSHLLFGGNNTAITAGEIDNSGTLSAANLDVAGFTLLQNSGRIESNAASYSGNTLDNQSGALLINAGNTANGLQLNVAQLTNSGTVHNSSLDMSLGGNLTNSGSMIHAGLGSLLLGSSGSINNAGGSIASAGTANIQNSIAGAGTVYAEQGMQLSSSGTFINNSQLYSKGDILVTSALHNQGGSLLSDANLTINTSGNVTNSGTLQGQNLSLTSAALNNNAGVITSTGSNNAQINAASLSNSGGIIQATNNNFTISTRSGELNNSNGQINHSGSGSLTLDSASHLNQQSGTVQSAGRLVVDAQGNLNNSYGVLTAGQYQLTASGSLNNDNGRIVGTGSSGTSSIQSGALLNRSGHIAANGTNLTLTSAALDNNAGSILLAGSGNLAITASSIANDAAGARIISNGAISLSGGSMLTNAGQISAANLLTVNAATLGNSGTLASRSGKVDIDSSGTLTNSGTVSGASGVDIDVRTLNNSAGLLQSDGLLDIAVNSLSVGQMQARDIALNSKGNIALQNGEHISAGRNINLHSDANIINSGTIVANGTLDITGKDLTNNSVGVIRAGGNAVLDLNKLTNHGTVSSNTVLTLDVDETINTGTLAAGKHLDINGNIINSNLVFAAELLTIDGNVDNTANIYSNRDAIISGSTVTNTGGSIAAAQDLSISGTIVNTHTGNINFVEGAVTTGGLGYVDDFYSGYDQYGPKQVIKVTAERRTTTTYSAELSGTAGIIASGRNMHLDGHTTNNYSKISVGGDLHVTGTKFGGNSASNQQIHQVEVYEDTVTVGCLSGLTDHGCAEPGPGYSLTEPVKVGEYTETTLTGGSLGTIYVKGSITGTLKDDVELNSASPLNGTLVSVSTNANGSSGSASRGNNATANSSGTVAVNRSSGTAKNTNGAERAASGLVAGNTVTVTAGWRDNNVSGPGNIEQQVIGQTPMQLTPVDGAVEGDNRQLNAGDLVTDTGISGKVARPVTTQGDVGQLQVTDQARRQVSIVQAGVSIQSAGFSTLNVGNSLSAASANAPVIPQQQGGGMVGNGNIAGSGGYNPDLIIKGLVDNQQGTLTAQKGSAQQQNNTYSAGQSAGQNVFITDAQMRVLTEDLGFDANAINQGQQGLYAAISQNDLLADGVTLSAGGTIDITADGGFNINSGIAAGEGLILRSENGLEMGNFGFFDSDKLLGLQLGGDFTNNMNLQSDTLWLDIGGNFTNQGSLTGSDVLSISAGKDLINQNLLSGGKVILDAGGDIINRVEFSQHTVQNGNNSTTYTTVGKAPQIISNDSLSMTAGNNIDLQGSKFASAGDISLNAGNDVLLGAVEKLSGHEKYFKGGHDIELNRTYDVVSFDAGGNLSVVAGNNLQSEGAVFAAVGDVELAAGNDMNLLGVVEYHEDRDKRTKKSTFKKTVYVDETYSADHQGSAIIAGGNVSLNAQQTADGLQVFNSGNVLLEGTYVNAGGNMVAYSEGELNIVSGEEWQAENHTKKKSMFGGLFGSTKTTETDVQYLGHADLNAGGDMVLLAQKDINVLAGKIDAGNIIAQAGFGNEAAKAADINILGDTETSSMYQETRRNGLALDFSDNFLSVAKETANENRITQTDYVGSVFTAKDNMALAASRDVNVVGSVLDAGAELLLDAGRDINVLTGQGSGSSYSRQTETKTGIAVSADSNTASVFAGDDIQKDALTSNSTTQTGSLLKADNVRLNAGNNLLISGSDINATTDIRLSAVKDINIVTAQELFNQQTEQSSTRDGLTVSANYNIGNTVDAISNLGQGGDATSVASSVMQAADTLNNAGPSAGAHLGQTTTTTTNTVQQGVAKGSSLTAGGDVIVSAGGNALFEGVKVNTQGNIDVDAENISVIAAQNSSGSQHNTEYLQVGLNLSAGGSNVSLTAGFSQSDSELNNQNTDAMGSSLDAGGNVSLNARNDLAIIGSDVNGDDNVELIAGNDIVIKAAESQFSSNSEDSHLSVGAGINFGSNGIGFTANMAMGEGELDREGTTHSNSHITAGKTLTVKSGNDTSIAGGNLAATDVDMNIGGDLTVASVQNTGQVKGDRWDVSANITVGAGASGGASVGYGETEGSSAWVNEQSSIIGSGSVTVRTEGHTQIDGAVIANIDENGNDGGNLSLDTGSLAYSDIADHDKEKSFYLNVGFTMGDDTSTNQKESDTNYSASGNYSNHDKAQINRATVGEGSIVVRDNPQQDLSDLNRDTQLAQEVTKDDSKDINLYVSTTALDSLGNLAEDPGKQLNQWKDNVASVGSADAWGNVAENATDALEDTYSAAAKVATEKDLGIGNFWTSLDSTHKITQLKNDLTRTAEGQALLGRLKSDDPDERLAAQAELGNMAQSKFGIDPSDILFYDGTETSSESLKDTLLADVKGATVTEQGHDEYGNILINVDNATDGKDMTNTLGHEVYETYTQQTGGANDASQEAIADMVGNQLANRIDQAMGGELANVGTGDLAGSNTVQYGNTRADNVGSAGVDYYLTKKTLDEVKGCLTGATCTSSEQKAAVVERAEALSKVLDNELNQVCKNSPTSDACRTAVNTATQYVAMAEAWDIMNNDVARSSENTFDYVYNSDGAKERFPVYYNTIDNRADFLGASNQYEQNLGLGAQWYGGAEFVSRAPLTGLGADGSASWATFGAGALLFPSTYNPLSGSEIYEWRSEAGNTLINAGFDNFKNLYNQTITDPVAWDINQLTSEQQALQPVHEKYLGERTAFTWVSKNIITNTNLNKAIDEAQGMPGGIDILDYESRVKFGCKLLGYSEEQGCKP